MTMGLGGAGGRVGPVCLLGLKCTGRPCPRAGCRARRQSACRRQKGGDSARGAGRDQIWIVLPGTSTSWRPAPLNGRSGSGPASGRREVVRVHGDGRPTRADVWSRRETSPRRGHRRRAAAARSWRRSVSSAGSARRTPAAKRSDSTSVAFFARVRPRRRTTPVLQRLRAGFVKVSDDDVVARPGVRRDRQRTYQRCRSWYRTHGFRPFSLSARRLPSGRSRARDARPTNSGRPPESPPLRSATRRSFTSSSGCSR